MSTEQLPDGLKLAVEIIESTMAGPNARSRARAAIRTEHAKRVALQHHACDLAQEIEDLRFAAEAAGRRIAELEAERDELRARLAEIEAQEPVAHLCRYRSGEEFASLARRPVIDPDVESSMPLYASPVHAQAAPEPVNGLVSVFSYDEVLTFTFCTEADADKFMARFDPTVDSATPEAAR